MDAAFLVNLSGKLYPMYAGVLSEAHERGLQSITVDLIQVPGPDNEHTAICRATVTLKDGSTFQEWGDASPRNVSTRMATALIRFAATRAKGRALRDAINCGQTLLEELPPEETTAPESPGDRRAASPPAPAPRAARAVQSAERETQAAHVSQPPPPPPPKWKAPDGKFYSRNDLAGSLAIRQARANERGIAWHEFDIDAADEGQIWEEITALVAAIQAHDSAAAA